MSQAWDNHLVVVAVESPRVVHVTEGLGSCRNSDSSFLLSLPIFRDLVSRKGRRLLSLHVLPRSSAHLGLGEGVGALPPEAPSLWLSKQLSTLRAGSMHHTGYSLRTQPQESTDHQVLQRLTVESLGRLEPRVPASHLQWCWLQRVWKVCVALAPQPPTMLKDFAAGTCVLSDLGLGVSDEGLCLTRVTSSLSLP